MKRLLAICLLMCAFVAGCTTTEALNVQPLALPGETAAQTPVYPPPSGAAPLGQAQVTGETPKFLANPSGAAPQLTTRDKAVVRRDLKRAAAPAVQQAAVDNQSSYEDGVEKLREEGNALLEERLKRIQEDSISEVPE